MGMIMEMILHTNVYKQFHYTKYIRRKNAYQYYQLFSNLFQDHLYWAFGWQWGGLIQLNLPYASHTPLFMPTSHVIIENNEQWISFYDEWDMIQSYYKSYTMKPLVSATPNNEN